MDAIDFLRQDYELKISYLTAHFSRMWTRFNFFLTIDSAVLAFSFDTGRGSYAITFLAIVGIVVSVLWYKFSAFDNFLVEVYRRQVNHVFELLRGAREAAFIAAGLEPSPRGYSYVGSVSNEAFNQETGQVEPIEQNMLQRRPWPSPKISVTELGVVFALLFTLLWVARLILLWSTGS
jgi:hypothetical protein